MSLLDSLFIIDSDFVKGYIYATAPASSKNPAGFKSGQIGSKIIILLR